MAEYGYGRRGISREFPTNHDLTRTTRTEENRPMSTTRKRSIERRIAMLEDELVRLEETESILPYDDPFADGDVLCFERSYSVGGETYSYVALRVDGRWYLSGTRGRAPLAWSSLRDLLLSDDVELDTVYAVTEWTPLVDLDLEADDAE